MSPSTLLTPQSSMPYTPMSDALGRHDYGVSKNRKPLASTGGGRAWSEDEEVYLLQTRLQKMPYKHIAAHLKKTELACRLHYHQLSHGSNRRKRTTSVSSGSSAGQSPILPAIVPSPIQECSSRASTPPGSSGGYRTVSPGPVQLPSIMGNPDSSARLPAILPKPVAMVQLNAPLTYTVPAPEVVRTLGPSLFAPPPPPPPPQQPTAMTQVPTLRLDCSVLPPPVSNAVDIPRLHSIYSLHRASFWATVANDYGSGANPIVLEQVWRSSVSSMGNSDPITPVTSPSEREPTYENRDKTRISSILGIDADPRSPGEREMVRRIEEERLLSATPVL